MAKKKTGAGAFDIRNVIGALIGIYGAALIFAFLVLDPGINVDTGLPKNSAYNLYVGIGLLVVCAGFLLWAKMKPVAIDEPHEAASD